MNVKWAAPYGAPPISVLMIPLPGTINTHPHSPILLQLMGSIGLTARSLLRSFYTCENPDSKGLISHAKTRRWTKNNPQMAADYFLHGGKPKAGRSILLMI